ncbi:MAG: hypothetical protein QFB86_02445 [Patescibacteria group bacterium]|nr:hypothetical protein [Patescibacteria group bacterium]
MILSITRNRTKRFISGSIAGLFLALQLPLVVLASPNISAISPNAPAESSTQSQADTDKAASEKKAQDEQEAKDKATNEEKAANLLKAAGDTNALTEQEAKDKVTTDKKAQDDQEVKDKTPSDTNAQDEQGAEDTVVTEDSVTIARISEVPDTAEVTLCHATSSQTNPYEEITVSAAGAYDGHYSQHEDDITPTFTYSGHIYAARGDQAVLEAGCTVEKENKVTLCHATSSQTNPYVEITVSAAGAYNGHYSKHADDITPTFTYDGQTYAARGDQTVLAAGCTVEETVPPKKDDEKVTLCHATSSQTNPYVLITVAAAGAFNGHYNDPNGRHDGDIIPEFTYKGTTYAAQNFSPTNQAILKNNCNLGGRGGGEIITTSGKSVLRTFAPANNSGAGPQEQLVNTGSSMIVNILTGTFIFAAAVATTVASRKRAIA